MAVFGDGGGGVGNQQKKSLYGNILLVATRRWLKYMFMRADDDTTIHKQIQDAKDLHHLSLVGSYNAAHLLHGFPPHFLHPAVTSASSASNPFSSSGGAFVKPFPSAFAPPTKCVGLGLEQVSKKKKHQINNK